MIELIWKEHLEGVRRKQYFAIGILLVGFALLSPVMMKALPVLLESQTGSEEMAAAIPVNLRESMRSFVKNIHQIATLLLVYLGASQIAYERNQRLVFPVHAGLKMGAMIRAKVGVYGMAVFAIAMLGTVLTALYGSVLLPGTWATFPASLFMGIEISCYLFFAYMMGMAAGSWIPSKMLATVLGSLVLFLMGWLAGFSWLEWIFPTYLMREANMLIAYWTKPLAGCILMTIAWSAILAEAVAWKLNRTNMTAQED